MQGAVRPLHPGPGTARRDCRGPFGPLRPVGPTPQSSRTSLQSPHHTRVRARARHQPSAYVACPGPERAPCSPYMWLVPSQNARPASVPLPSRPRVSATEPPSPRRRINRRTGGDRCDAQHRKDAWKGVPVMHDCPCRRRGRHRSTPFPVLRVWCPPRFLVVMSWAMDATRTTTDPIRIGVTHSVCLAEIRHALVVR